MIARLQRRSRFWGTPLPIWSSEDGSELRVVGSVEELEQLTGHKVRNVHSLALWILPDLRMGSVKELEQLIGHKVNWTWIRGGFQHSSQVCEL